LSQGCVLASQATDLATATPDRRRARPPTAATPRRPATRERLHHGDGRRVRWGAAAGV